MTYLEAVQRYGSMRAAARALNVPKTTFQERLRAEQEAASANVPGSVMHTKSRQSRVDLTIDDGVVVVFSDGHFWPGDESVAFLGLLHFIKNHKPAAVINAGDAFDGASVSRWPASGWADVSHRPTVLQELEACQIHLSRIEGVSKGRLLWALGNHDARYEMRLAQVAPQFAGVRGMQLKDHFPKWTPCWSVMINGNVMVKHRFRSGVHAGHNNTVNAGLTTVTGHTHQLEVKPFTDYNGTRYGVQCGTLSDLDGPKFAYSEDNPANHRSGFVVLTFRRGRLLQPETVAVWDEEHVEWRGRLWKVR